MWEKTFSVDRIIRTETLHLVSDALFQENRCTWNTRVLQRYAWHTSVRCSLYSAYRMSNRGCAMKPISQTGEIPLLMNNVLHTGEKPTHVDQKAAVPHLWRRNSWIICAPSFWSSNSSYSHLFHMKFTQGFYSIPKWHISWMVWFLLNFITFLVVCAMNTLWTLLGVCAMNMLCILLQYFAL